MKLLIMKFSPLPCYFSSLTFRYSPEQPEIVNTNLLNSKVELTERMH
jgi:hypothetical protein